MKRYYIIDPSLWPHSLPTYNADGSLQAWDHNPIAADDDARLLLGEAHFVDLGHPSRGGPPLFIVVVPNERSIVPATWTELGHVLDHGNLDAKHVQHLACYGILPSDNMFMAARKIARHPNFSNPAFEP